MRSAGQSLTEWYQPEQHAKQVHAMPLGKHAEHAKFCLVFLLHKLNMPALHALQGATGM
jgi:hypothetical protein